MVLLRISRCSILHRLHIQIYLDLLLTLPSTVPTSPLMSLLTSLLLRRRCQRDTLEPRLPVLTLTHPCVLLFNPGGCLCNLGAKCGPRQSQGQWHLGRSDKGLSGPPGCSGPRTRSYSPPSLLLLSLQAHPHFTSLSRSLVLTPLCLHLSLAAFRTEGFRQLET